MTAKKQKIFLVILTIMLCLCVASSFVVNSEKVYAGEIYGTLIDESFLSGESIDKSTWYNSSRADFAGVSFAKSNEPKLFITEGQGGLTGCGLNGTVAIPENCDTVQFTIDIAELNFGDMAKTFSSGWFGFVYNLQKSDYEEFNAYLVGQGRVSGCGIYFTYHPDFGLLFAPIGSILNEFYDGQGERIPQRTEYAFYDANSLLNNGEMPGITDTSVIITVKSSGEFVVSARRLGETGDGDIKIRATGFDKVKPKTFYGVSAHRSVVPIIKTAISNFKVEEIKSGKVINEFSEEHLKDWELFKPVETPNATFGFDYGMVLDCEFSESYPLFIQKEVTLNENSASFLEITVKVSLESISEGAEIGLLTGCTNFLKNNVGSPNTTFVSISEKDGAFYLGLKTYDENGTEMKLIRNSNDEINDNITIENVGEGLSNSHNAGFAELYVKIDNKGAILINVNGEQKYTSYGSTSKCYCQGYCGIALKGEPENMSVVFKNITLKNKYYSRPTNVNITETFDNGYNPNEFYFRIEPYMNTYTNSGYVKDGKLWFENLAYNTAFTTRFKYSDFEIQFDIDDIRRQAVKDDMGNKNYPVSSFVGVYWGVPDASTRFGDGVTTAYPLIYIASEVDQDTWERSIEEGKPSPTRIFALGNGMNTTFDLPIKYDFWDVKNEGKILQFRLTVTGDKVNVSVRYKGETEWCNVDKNGNPIEIKMRQAMVGNVAITTMGNNYYVAEVSEGASCGYFSLDNLTIVNNDNEPSLTVADDGTTYKDLPTDYEYTKPNNDAEYLPSVIQGGGCNSSVAGVETTIISMVFALMIIIIIGLRRKNHD